MRKLLFNILLFLSAIATAQSFKIESSKSELFVGEPCHIKLKYNGINKVIWRDNSNTTDTLSSEVEVLEYSKIDSIVSNDSITLTQILTVTAWDTGYHVIRPIEIEVNGSKLFSNPLLLKYKFEQIDNQSSIKDIKNQLDTPFIFDEIKTLVIWTTSIILLLAITCYTIIYFYKKRQVKVIKPKIKEKHIITILTERYEKLKTEKHWLNNKEKEFHSELSEILNKYLEYKYKIKSVETTSSETIQQLINLGLERKIIDQVKHILNFSDMIKFAKGKGAESQHEKALEILYSFLKDENKVE